MLSRHQMKYPKILMAGKPIIVEFVDNNYVGCRDTEPVLHTLA
jgi:hypothetical protein